MHDYSKLESLLYRGFLTSAVEVAGVPLVLKSLNQSEYDLIDLQSYTSDRDWKVEASYSLAYSTVFFNHINVLSRRHRYIPDLAESFRDMPESVLVSLLFVLNSLNEKAAEMMYLVQPYCYGSESRQNWMMRRGHLLCDPKITGFEGTERLGLNMHQKLWTYFNTTEDSEEEFMADYQLAKFIVSPHAGKDVQKLDQKDQKKQRTRDKRRKALYEGRDPSVHTEDGQIRITNETAEELMEQMERAVRGEKDYHDVIIEQHQEKIREGYRRKREEEEARRQLRAQQAREEYRRELEEDLEGFTPEEIEHYLRISDQRSFQRRQAVRESGQAATLEEREAGLLKWGFLTEDDLPEHRRKHYQQPRGEEFENPLIKEHYERVSNDLDSLRPPRWDDEE